MVGLKFWRLGRGLGALGLGLGSLGLGVSGRAEGIVVCRIRHPQVAREPASKAHSQHADFSHALIVEL